MSINSRHPADMILTKWEWNNQIRRITYTEQKNRKQNRNVRKKIELK